MNTFQKHRFPSKCLRRRLFGHASNQIFRDIECFEKTPHVSLRLIILTYNIVVLCMSTRNENMLMLYDMIINPALY